MKSSKTNMIPAGSVDDSIKSPMSYASAVINMRWNADNAAWTNDRGLQPFWEFPASFTYSDLAYPIDSETIEKFISKIVRNLEGLGESEIPTPTIGKFIMEGLSLLDKVAYVRFASVYKNFKEAKDFEQFVGNLDDNKS